MKQTQLRVLGRLQQSCPCTALWKWYQSRVCVSVECWAATVVAGHEGDVVEVVLDVGRLSVQYCPGGNPPVEVVYLQPVGRVEQLSVPVC